MRSEPWRSEPASAVRGTPWSGRMLADLLTLRERYAVTHDLLSAAELARLAFLRWLLAAHRVHRG